MYVYGPLPIGMALISNVTLDMGWSGPCGVLVCKISAGLNVPLRKGRNFLCSVWQKTVTCTSDTMGRSGYELGGLNA